MTLSSRIEAASGDQQRELLLEAAKRAWGWESCGDQDPDEWVRRWNRFHRKLDAEAYIDAALTLVPEGFWLELKGPRKYLNIPSPVPNYWSANIEQWNCEAQKMGWGATPALALAAAAIKIKESERADNG